MRCNMPESSNCFNGNRCVCGRDFRARQCNFNCNDGLAHHRKHYRNRNASYHAVPYIEFKRGIAMALITKLKDYREKANYKQSELAEMVNVRRETIVHLENGRYNPSLKLAMDIAKIFKVKVEDLFEFTDE